MNWSEQVKLTNLTSIFTDYWHNYGRLFKKIWQHIIVFCDPKLHSRKHIHSCSQIQQQIHVQKIQRSRYTATSALPPQPPPRVAAAAAASPATATRSSSSRLPPKARIPSSPARRRCRCSLPPLAGVAAYHRGHRRRHSPGEEEKKYEPGKERRDTAHMWIGLEGISVITKSCYISFFKKMNS